MRIIRVKMVKFVLFLILFNGPVIFGASLNSVAQVPVACSPQQGQWTEFSQSAATLVFYVSNSSGNNAFDGLFPDNSTGGLHGPKKTIAAGISMLRSGYPDWLLLKRGDQWQESLGNWQKSGLSPIEPMLVSSYGSSLSRPLLQTGISDGISFCCSSNGPSHLAFVGLDFLPHTYTGAPQGPIGASILGSSNNVLFEDCRFRNYSTNIRFQAYPGPTLHTNIKLRRSIIQGAYSTAGHSQGVYAYAVNGLLIEENIFYHNGWNQAGVGADMFRHNGYIDNGNYDVRYCGNISADASSHGVQMRSGGEVRNNLFLRNSIAFNVGGGNSPDPGGVHANVYDNVIVDGKDIDPSNPRGWAIHLANIKSGIVQNTIIANNPLAHNGIGIMLDGDHVGDPGNVGIGIHFLRIVKNIIYNWTGSSSIEGNSSQVTQLALKGNEISNVVSGEALFTHAQNSTTQVVSSFANRFHSTANASAWFGVGGTSLSLSAWKSAVGDSASSAFSHNYPDPDRTVADYNALNGGQSTHADFIARLLMQSKMSWNPKYTASAVNNYFREGFGR